MAQTMRGPTPHLEVYVEVPTVQQIQTMASSQITALEPSSSAPTENVQSSSKAVFKKYPSGLGLGSDSDTDSLTDLSEEEKLAETRKEIKKPTPKQLSRNTPVVSSFGPTSTKRTKKPVQYHSTAQRKRLSLPSTAVAKELPTPATSRGRKRGRISVSALDTTATSPSRTSVSPPPPLNISPKRSKPLKSSLPSPRPHKRTRRAAAKVRDYQESDEEKEDEDEEGHSAPAPSKKRKRAQSFIKKPVADASQEALYSKSSPTRPTQTLDTRPIFKSSYSTSFLGKSLSKALTLEEPWNVTKLGSLVWVRIGVDGQVWDEDEPSEDVELQKTMYWWPAKCHKDSSPLKVSLYGEENCEIPRQKDYTISHPSSKNILPYRTNQSNGSRIRFDSLTFTTGPKQLEVPIGETPSTSTSEATPKQPSDIENAWLIAFQQLAEEDEKDNDDLPDPSLLLYFSQSPSRSQASKQVIVESDLSSEELTPQKSTKKRAVKTAVAWEADEDVSVGAAVLCLDKKGGSHYWPAKVEAVNPPKGKAVEGTYSILFCDGARKQVTRKWILVQEEEEFFTCKLGEIVAKSKDRGRATHHDDTAALRSTPCPRANSPSFEPKYHPTSDEFADLELREQVGFIRHILQCIIENKDQRAQRRHDMFMKGGKSRASLLQQMNQGDLTDEQMHDVLWEIRRFVLRSDRWIQRQKEKEDVDGDVLMDEVNAEAETAQASLSPKKTVEKEKSEEDETSHEWMPSNKFPRLIGSSEYESLSATERSQYCSDVILPEAIIHLYAWRHGLYDGQTDLGEEDEERIYNQAAEAMSQGPLDAWVDELLLHRQMFAPKSSRHKEDEPPVRGGTRSRRIYK